MVGPWRTLQHTGTDKSAGPIYPIHVFTCESIPLFVNTVVVPRHVNGVGVNVLLRHVPITR